MLDHVSITVSDIAAAERFYDAIMKALDVVKVGRSDDWLGYGERADAQLSGSRLHRHLQGREAGRGHRPALVLQGEAAQRGRRVLARRHRRRRHRRRTAGPAPLSRLLLCRVPARSRRQQGRGGVPPGGVASAGSVARDEPTGRANARPMTGSATSTVVVARYLGRKFINSERSAGRIISHAAELRVLSFQVSKILASAWDGVAMSWREFIDFLGGGSIAWSLALPDASGQELRKAYRVGFQTLFLLK